MTCNIAINGFFGRMGQSIHAESITHKSADITLGCDIEEKIKNHQGVDGVILTSDITSSDKSFDVVIDFSLPNPSINTINACVLIKKPMTIGTTGFDDKQLSIIKKASKTIPILLAPNMSQGVNVSLKSLETMSKALKGYDVLIKEVHHVNKVDSPSGTAIKMAQVICKGLNIELEKCPIKFESLRENTEIGTHEVIFTSNSDSIHVKHLAKNRSIFAKGAIETSIWISSQKPGLYSYLDYMDDVS
jgi:4-hydroxy-tetrahydrodipicolinate reductase